MIRLVLELFLEIFFSIVIKFPCQKLFAACEWRVIKLQYAFLSRINIEEKNRSKLEYFFKN